MKKFFVQEVRKHQSRQMNYITDEYDKLLVDTVVNAAGQKLEDKLAADIEAKGGEDIRFTGNYWLQRFNEFGLPSRSFTCLSSDYWRVHPGLSSDP